MNAEQPKSIEQYEELLKGNLRVQLKEMNKIIDLLLDKRDMGFKILITGMENKLTINEDEVKGRGFSMDDIKDIYFRFSAKKFEVFVQSDYANPFYTQFLLPDFSQKDDKWVRPISPKPPRCPAPCFTTTTSNPKKIGSSNSK